MSKIIGFCVTLILLRLSTLEHVFAHKETATLPKPPNCGKQFFDRLTRPSTEIDDFPWTALIEYRNSYNGQTRFNCGGSLINSRYILTAAHCIKAIPNGWEVSGARLGEWDPTTDQDCESTNRYCADAPVDVGIEKIVVHEDYAYYKSRYNNIALIRLNKTVDMTDYISPVCLPVEDQQRSQNLVGSTGYVSGWGRMGNGFHGNDEKLKIRSNITDSDSCASSYGRLGVVLKHTQMCVKALDSWEPCMRGGSPFMKQEHFRDYVYLNYLYGISSMGSKSCGSKDMPDVFTNVAKYIDWIVSKME